MSRRPFFSCLHRVSALLRGCAIVFAMSACSVSITKQSATDPCDPNPCAEVGVCTGWTGTCTSPNGVAVCSDWKANGTPPKDKDGKTLSLPAGYETIETLCDGIDNDCNGLTDEGVAPPKGVCSAIGVCAGQTVTHAVCNAGTWLCEWTGVDGYEETEVSCDGKDNDCDGKTDENVTPGLNTCKRQGVCASLPAATCSNGAWDCAYGGADYQAVESACDGKDNDCDGIVDANLTVTGLSCLGQGVCAIGVKQVCSGGVATCDYTGVAGFEAFEQSCDGQDNDCDGVTDNLAGSTLPLQAKDTSDCVNLGVCGLYKDKIVRRCEAGQFVCNYGAVPKYESKESSCDGKDNDCDGTTDQSLSQPSLSPCPSTGVCGSATASCTGGLWTCNWASVASAGYEAFETLCDGKDNDCDGQTDETVSAKSAKCKSQGVCGFGAAVTCANKVATCDYSHIAGFQTTETLCDGMDNDCDGQTDEPDALDVTASGCSKGVCATASASCSAGVWKCDTTAIAADYEAVETKCDGKDNDCDGLTDEGAVDASSCKSKGVCAAGVPAACVNAQSLCVYQSVAGYESTEVSCDGLDNNCDGKTDLNVCAPAAPCQGDLDCTTGSCTTVLGGTGKACTVKPKQCAAIGDFGAMVFADDAGTRCLTSKSVASCSAGTWGTPTVCGSNLPVCVAGACVLCTPNALRCDPADATKIQQCAADGKSVTPKGACSSGDHCSGDGVCVPDASVAVNDTTSGYGGVLAVLGNGKVATAWLTDSSSVASVSVRLFTANGAAVGPGTVIHGSAAAIKSSQVAITTVGDGFAVAWTSKAAGDADIYVRLFDGAGVAKGAAFIANAPNDTQGEQTEPALASNGSDFVATWTTSDFEGNGTKGIAAQRFDASGQLAGDLVLANEDLNGNFNDNPLDNDEQQPAVTMRADGSFLIVWVQVDSQVKQRIRGHLFNAASAPVNSVVAYTSAAGTSSRPAVAQFAKGFAVVWSGSATDGAGTGIALRQVDTSGAAIGQPSVVNTTVAGDQVDPTIVQLANGGAVVGWTSPQAVSAGDGLEVSSRTLAPDGTFPDAEVVVSASESAGDQSSSHVVVFSDGRLAWIWRFLATPTDPSQVRLLLP